MHTPGNKDLVLSPRWVLYAKTDWPTEPSVVTRNSQNLLFNFLIIGGSLGFHSFSFNVGALDISVTFHVDAFELTHGLSSLTTEELQVSLVLSSSDSIQVPSFSDN
jgi:hypothetical protein